MRVVFSNMVLVVSGRNVNVHAHLKIVFDFLCPIAPDHIATVVKDIVILAALFLHSNKTVFRIIAILSPFI